MKTTLRFMICGCFVVIFSFSALADDAEVSQKLFERVFGDAARLDLIMRNKVLKGKPGERHYIDADADGRPEEVWFIDTALRHPESWRPLLVRVIDEDGDLQMNQEPDLDSDLYVADWKADGTVDAVCDYTDRDGDNDADEMGLYFPAGKMYPNALMLWWGDDIGDDNLLWYDIGYTYRQQACQYHSHFGGDELFCAFVIGLDDAEWLPLWENPFTFYDHDHDGVTEEVVRICGRSEKMENLRHSFDADNDATPENPRDFDVSISAYAPEGATFDPRYSDRRVLRGIPTGPFLSYDITPHYARESRWVNPMLTWDENDLNIDGDNLRDGRFTDTQERWEGIIAKGNEFFKQIGGPSSGPFNKRFEMVTAATVRLRLYYAPTDQRLHLLGAGRMWLAVDLDYDNQPDMRYEYADRDGDGRIDTWILDRDADGKADDEWHAGDAAVTEIGYTWPEVTAIIAPLVKILPTQLFQLDQRLLEATAQAGRTEPDPVWKMLESGFDTPYLTDDVRIRLLSSNESLRYYLDLYKDRLIADLKERYKNSEFWNRFDVLRAKGDLDGLAALVESAFNLSSPLPQFADWRAAVLERFAAPRVAWAQDWVPPNIGWESNLCGYRAYWGQFDFFGKKQPGLVMHTFGDQTNYHAEQDWGMDALHVGSTAGLGGVTLYVNGQAYPVYSPNGEGNIVWSKQMLSAEKDKIEVELAAKGVGPKKAPYTVRFRCAALAERRDSPVVVVVEGGVPGDHLELGIGLTRLPQESFALDTQAGIMASWGSQSPEIGTIGLGIVFAPSAFRRTADSADEHQVVLSAATGVPIHYHIQGDWLRGRRFPCCPNLGNWVDELRAAARIAGLR